MKCIYSFSTHMSISLLTLFALEFSPLAYADPRLPTISTPLLAERPSNLGYPRNGTRRGGGSRGDLCELLPGMSPLTALMPDTATWTGEETGEEVVFSLTEHASPDLWVYVPYRLENPDQLRVTLKDSADNQLLRVQLEPDVALPATPGIIRASLGDLGISLLPDVDYRWYVTVRCGDGPPVTVDGWLRYQESPGNDTPNNGFFVDDLSSFATGANENDQTAPWQELLNSVGLSDISDAPILDCCRFVTPVQN